MGWCLAGTQDTQAHWQEPRIPRPMPLQGRVHSSRMYWVRRLASHLPCPLSLVPAHGLLGFSSCRGRTLPRRVLGYEGGLGPLLLSCLPQEEPSLKIWGCFQSPRPGGGSWAAFGAPGKSRDKEGESWG